MKVLVNFIYCFLCTGRVISQNLFINFTFEIIDYFKCRSNQALFLSVLKKESSIQTTRSIFENKIFAGARVVDNVPITILL